MQYKFAVRERNTALHHEWIISVSSGHDDRPFPRRTLAGATILQDLTERDYGSREFICADPEGNVWSFGTYRPEAA